jgi:hypothetical protein
VQQASKLSREIDGKASRLAAGRIPAGQQRVPEVDPDPQHGPPATSNRPRRRWRPAHPARPCAGDAERVQLDF